MNLLILKAHGTRSVSILTSWPQTCSRDIHFCPGSGVFYDTGINPCILFPHVDDAQHKGRTAPLVEFKMIFVLIITVVNTVGVVAFSHKLYGGVLRVRIEPEDVVTGDVPTVTFNSLTTGDGGVQDFDRFV